MVDVTQAFHNLIKAGTKVTDIVGSNVFNDSLPQPFRPPAIVFWALSESVFFDLESAKAISISQATMTCRCYGRDRTQANQLAWELWIHLDGFAGVEAGVLIKDLSRDGGTSHTFDEVSGGTDQRRFISQLDFVVSYDSVNEYPLAAATGKATTTGKI